MALQHILEEIEQAAERCTKAGTAVHDALDVLDLGAICGFLQTVASDAPVRSSRRSTAASLLKGAPGKISDNGEGLFAKFERLLGNLPTDLKAKPSPATAVVAVPGKPAPTRTDTPAGEEKVDDADPFATLQNIYAVQFRAGQPLPPRSPLDILREVLAKAEHPLVKALYEANDALEHVETIILPKVHVLVEEYQDKTVASHHEKMALLANKRVEATKLIGMLIAEILKKNPTKGASPVEAAKFVDIAFGRGRDSLVGLFVGCTVLIELGIHLKQIGSRLQTKMTISEARVGSKPGQAEPGTHGSLADGQNESPHESTDAQDSRKVFVVHGHDEVLKLDVARFIEKLGLKVVILAEQANQGRTIIEKFEAHAEDAGFAIVLLTPDDVGASAGNPSALKSRARQNVILELGYFIGKLTRCRVCALHKGDVELPSDILGIVYVPIAGNWKLQLAGEMKTAWPELDLNKAY